MAEIKKNKQAQKKPYIGVIFKCCRIYSRIYMNAKGNGYVGWCPKCAAKMEVIISPFGSKQSFFTAE